MEEENKTLKAGAEKFRQRSPELQGYLQLIPILIKWDSLACLGISLLTSDRQNGMMRERLASLGFQMPLDPLPMDVTEEDANRHLADLSRSASNHTGHRSADTLVNHDTMTTSSPHTRPAKRQRVDSPLPERNIHAAKEQHGVSNGDRMPPPPRTNKAKSVKKILNTLRGRKGSRFLGSRGLSSDSPPVVDARTSETLPIGNALHFETERSRPEHNSHEVEWAGNEQYMTGAIPVHEERQPPEKSQQSHAPAFNGAPAQFSFRSMAQSYPANTDTRAQKESSYIHLMDPLSRESALDLGIVDPRQRPSQCAKQNGHYVSDPRMTASPNGQQISTQWNLGHAFLPQQPKGTSMASENHPDPLRSNPAHIREQQPYADHAVNTTSVNMQHGQNLSLFPHTPAFHRNHEFVTPAPQRFQQPALAEESVVSPFYKSSICGSPVRPKAMVNERDHSSLPHSDAYRFPGPSRKPHCGWQEARDLNGLSFIHSPLNQHNEPIEPGHRAYGRQHDSRNVTSRGFIQRPDRRRTPMTQYQQQQQYHDAYAYNRLIDRAPPLPSSSRRATGPLKSNYMFPSSSQHSKYRTTPLLTTQPSLVPPPRVERPISSRVNSQIRYPSVARENGSVRVANISRTHVRSSTYAPSGRSLYSSAGRRAVRR